MKTLAPLFSLALASTTCQPQTVATEPATPSLTLVNYRPAAVPAPPATALSAADLKLLRTHNLAALLQGREAKEGASPQVLNGFFGPSGYRIELVITSVQGDLHQPNVFRVRGKSRYKKVVTPFSGLITITQLVKQPATPAREVAEGLQVEATAKDKQNQPDSYTAIGRYELREEATQPGAGVFQGQVALDLLVNSDGSVEELTQRRYLTQATSTATQGGGLTYKGTWTNNATGHDQPVVWVHNIFTYRGPQALTDLLLLGDRTMRINPKYARLGWNKLWENDEWWADAPSPAPGM